MKYLRTRGPVLIATLFTFVAIGLAVAPGLLGKATYHAGLAVLTATLIAVIWYAYFTWQASRTAETVLRDARRASEIDDSRRLDGLLAQVRALRKPVDELLNEQQWSDVVLHRAVLPAEKELREFVQSAAYFGSRMAGPAHDVERLLRRFSSELEKVRQEDRRSGVAYRDFPHEDAREWLTEAGTHLGSVGSLVAAFQEFRNRVRS